MFGMCLNWKVLGGLGAVALAIFLLRPQLGPSLLPLVFVLACPLSMVLMMGGMMRGMGGMGGGQAPPLVASPQAGADPGPDPVEVLRQRYARGEIEHEELSRRLGDLLDPKLGG
ncbi:MAG: SHOCT domain-containing protein [Candidatus Dormibacteria bacterium]